MNPQKGGKGTNQYQIRGQGRQLVIAPKLTIPAIDIGALDYTTRFKLARDPTTTPEMLLVLARDGDPNLDNVVIANANCPPQAITLLAKSSSYKAREAVASHPLCPPDILSELASDTNQQIRLNVVEHPDCPDAALFQICGTESPGPVLVAAASKPCCTAEVLDKLVVRLMNTKAGFAPTQRDSALRAAIANPNICSGTLGKLLADSRFDRLTPTILGARTCPVDVLVQAGMSTDPQHRALAAAHPNTPSGLLGKMIKDSQMQVKRALAGNPSTPTTVLMKLAGHRDQPTLKLILANPNCPDHLRVIGALSR